MIEFALEIEVPSRPEDIAVRHHNRFVKESLREVLKEHHAKRIPGHFKTSAHQKYGYQRRNLKYMKAKNKRHGSSRDLVKTGQSEMSMTNAANANITIGGAAEGGKNAINAKLTLRFPWKGGAGRFRRETPTYQKVTIQQMIKEMQAMTDEERQQMAVKFNEAYWARAKNLQGKRQRKISRLFKRVDAGLNKSYKSQGLTRPELGMG